jgi:hypothetical protein
MTSTAVKRERTKADRIEKERKARHVQMIEAAKTPLLEVRAPIIGMNINVRARAGSPFDAWLHVATRHIAAAQNLADRGWRYHVAFYREMEKARAALSCALYWEPTASSAAVLRDKIDDLLTAPRSKPCRS